MSHTPHDTWLQQNQQYLMVAVAEIRTLLEEHYSKLEGDCTKEQPKTTLDDQHNTDKPLAPPALETLCTSFGLSNFERAILLLCAGMESHP